MSCTIVRSALFVPGNRPERFDKALASGADAVIIDLEDAVAPQDKPQARVNLQAFLERQADARVLVRVNAAGHCEHEADLQLCRRLPGVVGILLPKAETPSQVLAVAATHKPVWPLIESARGVLAIEAIAACAGVARLTFGALDLALDLGMQAGSRAADSVFDQVRYAMLLHSRVNDLASPLDSVYPDFENAAGLDAAMRRGRDMGLGGALCIHPRQVAVIHAALAATAQEKAWAQRVLDAATSGQAVFEVDGQMVDAPVIDRARRLLAQG
ncbi:CoA ester lyase [Pseudomonas sp. GD03860]|uniref:HpcH/HpaI aldolase/citrate lyase family protein n=1 Tax=Pseudomonas TaxID=286 RepID=UPI002364001E|nr:MULTISPECIES: CoA ester lyase [Pseudomonas]MDD2058475.1 CoA ester lyase [Pseudomonas putida]MDH0640424.1 CoA ester lyase [Pseudomonas sp. GD03860]